MNIPPQKYTLFSRVHRVFSSIDHMLGPKASPDKFKKTEIISNIFYYHNDMQLELNYKKRILKNTDLWQLKVVLEVETITKQLLSSSLPTEYIQRDIDILSTPPATAIFGIASLVLFN